MATIDYKEKYEQALEVAQRFYNNSVAITKKGLEDIFPELRESEDERIRKYLIDVVNDYCKGSEHDGCIAWLEKLKDVFAGFCDWNDYKDKPVDVWNAYTRGFNVGQEIGKNAVKNCPEDYGLEKQAEQKAKYHDICDKCVRQPTCQSDCFLQQDEQKPADKVEPKFKIGDTMRTLIEAKCDMTVGMPVVVSIDDKNYYCNNETIAIKDQDDYEYPPMNRKQNPAWSEYDEEFLLELSQCCDLNKTQVQWLLSLKDRVQPQSKQEWSEEDRETIDYLIDYLESELDSSYTKVDKEEFTKEIELLKSLKERYTWKPSDEQMNNK